MKKLISVVLLGTAITTAALAFASRQGAADKAGCGACCPAPCDTAADT